MVMEKERLEIIEYGKKLINANLTKGTGGNLSIYNRKEKLMAITPTGIDFFKIEPKNIVIMNENNEIIDSENEPSSEWYMHKIVYEQRKDIDAIIHSHTMYATIFACLRRNILPTHYMIAVAGKDVKCAKYATYGSKELAENALLGMKDRKAVLLANHGILAGSKDLLNTFNIIEEVEYCAEVYYRARTIGNPVILDDEEMTIMAEKFKTYGQRK